jgi:RimJ/RimL family protein N-acetyltransferase
MAMLGGVKDDASTVAYLERNVRHWDEHGFGLWMLRLEPTGPVIGRGLLRRLNVEGVDEVEIGYSFEPEFWGRGLATEIAVGCLEQGRQRGFQSMVAVTLPGNAASRRVLEKAGLHYERDVMHAALLHVLYRT